MNSEHPFRFDAEKALEVILYISKNTAVPDIYHVCKILYFADCFHLRDYGRFVCGDEYFALQHGPVPSGTYDLIRDVQNIQRQTPYADKARSAFRIDGSRIIPTREPELEYLSESDRESIDTAIRRFGRLPFGKLKELSHDAAFFSADVNGEISINAIAAMLPDTEFLLDDVFDCESEPIFA